MSVDFISGVELSRRLYDDAVRPLLSRHLPGLAHSAALIGTGSEVLGFDTPRPTITAELHGTGERPARPWHRM